MKRDKPNQLTHTDRQGDTYLFLKLMLTVLDQVYSKTVQARAQFRDVNPEKPDWNAAAIALTEAKDAFALAEFLMGLRYE